MKNKLKLVVVLPLLMVLMGCQDPVNQWTTRDVGEMSHIKGFEDCTYTMVSTGAQYLHVIRCPNSATSTMHKQGKSSVNNVVIDDVRYYRKD